MKIPEWIYALCGRVSPAECTRRLKLIDEGQNWPPLPKPLPKAPQPPAPPPEATQ
jgi:hypothetical protein